MGESVGEGVTSVVPGDVVIPCYTPECKKYDCIFCRSHKTNLCPAIRATQGQGFMPDGTSRLSKDGKQIFHFMGCSTFAEYAVIAEMSAAKINPGADLNKMCLLGCGVSTGWGAVYNTTKVEPNSSIAVFGLGALGLSVIQAAKTVGARYIVGVDINDDWQFGSAAGWYLDATVEPWSKHYKMYSYITKELPSVVAGLFPVDPVRRSITGHSMGGHGALICHLKNPGMYQSVSAFAPACNPTAVPWGEKFFPGYLGSLAAGKAYDATELVKTYSGPKPAILIDVGTHDWVLTTQLKPDNFAAACGEAGYPLQLRMQPKYDHSYYFVSTFMRDHVDHHARALGLRCTI